MKAVAICPPASEEWGVCLIGHPKEVGLTLLKILFSTLSWVSELPSNYKRGGGGMLFYPPYSTNTCSVSNDYELGTLETHVSSHPSGRHSPATQSSQQLGVSTDSHSTTIS